VTQRILFSESSPNLGGQELQLLQQMVALRARGIAVRLVCRADSDIHRAAMELGLEVELVPFRNSLHLPSIRRIVKLLRSWRPEVVISHSGHDANNCAIAARLAQPRPLLVRARTYQHGIPHAWTYNWLSDLTIVPSREMRERVMQNRKVRAERIHILYPGQDFATIAANALQPLPETVERWLVEHPGRVLVHAAMLRGEKGHRFMLDVIAKLLPDFPDLRYVIAGEGPERAAIEQKVRDLRLEEHVFLAGMVQPVAALLKRATMVIMPSLIEPLGMAQIEALSLGVPVVGSNTGGIPETIAHQQTGLLAEPGMLLAWQQAIAWGLEHYEQMQAMAAVGKADVLNRFSIEANIGKLLQLITGARQDDKQ
jgi:glycosyltransferase involved in cell wall biosynthesis